MMHDDDDDARRESKKEARLELQEAKVGTCYDK